MGLVLFIALIGVVGTTAAGVVIYRNRKILFSKQN
jgi:hypothetical protein